MTIQPEKVQPRKNALAPFDLAQAEGVAGQVLYRGRVLDVMEADGFVYRAIQLMDTAPETAGTDVLYEAAARVLPSLTREEVDTLTARQVGAVLGIAQLRTEEVASQFPNAESPAETKATDTPPG